VIVNFIWLLSLATASAVYLQALHGGFLFDDFPNIVDNTSIHLTSLSLTGLIDSLDGARAGPLGRPVSVMSFALTHWTFGLDPYAFKATNLVIHLVNGVLVGWFVSLFLSVLSLQGLTDGMRRWLPLWVATAWLWHPIHFVAINMAVQRMTLLAAMFILLGLIAHLSAVRTFDEGRSGRGRVLVAWGICWPLAVFSKETGLLFPVFVLLITLFAGNVATLTNRRSLVLSGATIAVAGLSMAWRIGWSWLEAGYAVRDFGLVERLMTEARVLWFYLSQILLPSYDSFALYLDGFSVSRGFFQPASTLLSLVAWGGSLGIAIAYRRRLPMLSFGLLWFLVGHSLESSFVPLEIAHEHRNYLPALGPLLAAGYYGGLLVGRLHLERQALVISVLALAPLALLATLTALRSAQMGDPLIGAQMEATRHENSARANYVAGQSLFKAGLGDMNDPIGGKSIRFFFEQAERADSGFKLGYLGLIIWSCASERSVEEDWLVAFAERLEYTSFSHGQVPLPAYLLKPLLSMPTCLSRAEALHLFEAGGRNTRVSDSLRSAFLEAAAEYELLVSGNPQAAREYYLRAGAFDPGNLTLKEKIRGLSATP